MGGEGTVIGLLARIFIGALLLMGGVLPVVQAFVWEGRHVLFSWQGSVQEGHVAVYDFFGFGYMFIDGPGPSYATVRRADRGKKWAVPGGPEENAFRTIVALQEKI